MAECATPLSDDAVSPGKNQHLLSVPLANCQGFPLFKSGPGMVMLKTIHGSEAIQSAEALEKETTWPTAHPESSRSSLQIARNWFTLSRRNSYLGGQRPWRIDQSDG